MFHNKVYLGVLAGLAATLVKDLANHILYSLKIIKILLAHYAAGVFITAPETRSWLGTLVGYIVDLGLSALLGIIFVFLFKKTNPTHLLFKGFLYGIALFISIYGALISFGISSVTERPIMDVFLMFPIHLIYGLVLGFVAQKYGKKALKSK